jgi:dCMP deaminase
MPLSDKWIDRFAGLARGIASWSPDPSTKVGAVIFNDDHVILAQGFNAFPRGVRDDMTRYLNRPMKLALIAHAEANAIAQAARVGARLLDASLLVTALHPCSDCAKLIIQSGIRTVYAPATPNNAKWSEESEIAQQLFSEAGVQVVTYDS